MKSKFELILSYLANELDLNDTDSFEILLLGNSEGTGIQTCYNPGQNLPTNYEFDNYNPLKDSIKNIIDLYYFFLEVYYVS